MTRDCFVTGHLLALYQYSRLPPWATASYYEGRTWSMWSMVTYYVTYYEDL